MNPPVGGAYRTATRDTNIGPIDVKAGDHVFASILSANRDVRQVDRFQFGAFSQYQSRRHPYSSLIPGLMARVRLSNMI